VKTQINHKTAARLRHLCRHPKYFVKQTRRLYFKLIPLASETKLKNVNP